MGKEISAGRILRNLIPDNAIHRVDVIRLHFFPPDAASLVEFVSSCPNPAFRYHQSDKPQWLRWGKLFWEYYLEADTDGRQSLLTRMSILNPYLQVIAAEMAWQATILREIPGEKLTSEQMGIAESFIGFLSALRDQHEPNAPAYLYFQEEIRTNTVFPRAIKNRILGMQNMDQEEALDTAVTVVSQ